MNNVKITGLAKCLVDAQLISKQDIAEHVEKAHLSHMPLISYLIQNNIHLGPNAIRVYGDFFDLPVLNLDAMNLSYIPKHLIPQDVLRENHFIPLYKNGKTLFIGMADPNNQSALELVHFSTNLVVHPILIENHKLKPTIDDLFNDVLDDLQSLEDDGSLDNLEIEIIDDDESDNNENTDDAPVVKFVHKMLLSAIQMGASDLHFEPYEKFYRIRFRIDGILKEIMRPAIVLNRRISSRLKIMANLDISERRNPQDGRIKMKISKNKSIDFRINTLPTLWGEKIVIRILDSSAVKLSIDALGYSPEQHALYKKYLNQSQGMILVTGPTGSGKTISLYTGLHYLNTKTRNILSVEDPVEIYLEGINQVHVNLKQGLDFPKTLRAFLRQDPDVIMIGEIRDLETATIAIKAAQTGHTVLSTVHTNSAAETLTRLISMGVPAFNLATSLNLIIAQRLARKLCEYCKKRQKIPVSELIKQGFTEEQASATLNLFTAHLTGCKQCVNGYKGRLGIFEVIPVIPSIQTLMMSNGNSIELNDLMRKEGYPSLRQSGLKKVLSGITSLEEINRVTTN
ncbi:MAG: type IV-A pilus assembly ATPase PilB [Endozoicomonadaceae bacterium]|nr:type IV-A pilus assembly ATPase PilB [Endozoicomonadaceae bacterium]